MKTFDAPAHPYLSDESENGAELLDDAHQFTKRFVAYPSEHAAHAHVLWCAHTHAMAAWNSTPRLAFLSPEPGSGKSRALEITELLVPRPVASVNVSPAYLFRKAADPDGAPTILFDEIDTVFGPKARDNEDVRGFLNAGHRRGATAGRCVVIGKTVTTEELSAYCAVAVAGIGNLPDTILTRSVIVRMRRRCATEKVEPYRPRTHAGDGETLRDRLSRWINSNIAELGAVIPLMPTGVEDRAADVWEPLLAIADAAGGHWPARARAAAVALVMEATEATPSLGVRLLEDLRAIFAATESFATAALLSRLCELDEAPWGDLRGKPLDSRSLANYMRPYGIQSKTIRIGTVTAKGYVRADLADAWNRYLPALGPAAGVTCVTGGTDQTGML